MMEASMAIKIGKLFGTDKLTMTTCSLGKKTTLIGGWAMTFSPVA